MHVVRASLHPREVWTFSAYLTDSLDLYGGARSGEESKEEIGYSEAIRGGTHKYQ